MGNTITKYIFNPKGEIEKRIIVKMMFQIENIKEYGRYKFKCILIASDVIRLYSPEI